MEELDRDVGGVAARSAVAHREEAAVALVEAGNGTSHVAGLLADRDGLFDMLVRRCRPAGRRVRGNTLAAVRAEAGCAAD